MISVLLLLYPLLVNGYTFAHLECKLNMWSAGCESVLIASRQFTSIANIIQAASSLLVGTLTYIKMPPINAATKIERRMLFHSVYSSLLLTLYAVFQGAEAVIFISSSNYPGFFTLIKSISNIIYLLFHYSSIVILFFVWFVSPYFLILRRNSKTPVLNL